MADMLTSMFLSFPVTFNCYYLLIGKIFFCWPLIAPVLQNLGKWKEKTIILFFENIF